MLDRLVRFLANASFNFRSLVQRAGGLSLVLLAIACAAFIYTYRERRKLITRSAAARAGDLGSASGHRSSRKSGVASGSASNTSGRLAGVKRVTVGLDASIPVLLTNVSAGDSSHDGADAIVPVGGDSTERSKAFALNTLAPLTLSDDTVTQLSKLASRRDLYIITRVDGDEAENHVRQAFERSGLFASGVHPAKLLFCDTVVGRISAVRQLEPSLHIDCDYTVISGLQRFVARLLHINPDGSGAAETQANVTSCRSLEWLFDE